MQEPPASAKGSRQGLLVPLGQASTAPGITLMLRNGVLLIKSPSQRLLSLQASTLCPHQDLKTCHESQSLGLYGNRAEQKSLIVPLYKKPFLGQ